MIALFHFIRLAVLNLRRGGQRVLVALLCITFGVMALVALNMLAQSIAGAVEITPRELLGGDLSMTSKSEDALRPQDVAQLDALQQGGEITSYTLIAYNNASIMFRAAGSAEMHFAGNGMGIQPEKYPLAGSLVIRERGNSGLPAVRLPTLLRQVGDVVVTRDIAEEYHLKVGSPVVLSDLRAGIPVVGVVRGIAYDTPNHQGDNVYYSIETAQKLANGMPVVNTVIANTAKASTLTGTLENSGWSVDWAAGRGSGKTANLWVIGLRGAGILGLLVGGIGIANTMQVLLRRRQREIAIWKTLGYRAGHLRLIFALEAGLLGLLGSLLGAGLGVLISIGLIAVFRRTSSLLYEWTFSPFPPLLGILAGTLTTVIFAAWAIAITSQARPMALLRNEPVAVSVRSGSGSSAGCQSVLLGLVLAAPFTVLASLVMESVFAGIGVVAAIGFAVVGLGGFFSALLWACTRVFPLSGFPFLRIAIMGIQRGGGGNRGTPIFAMITLFAGVLSLSAGLVVMRVSELRSSGQVDLQGYNLNILAAPDQESAIRKAVQAQRPEKVSVGYRAALAALRVANNKGEGESTTTSSADQGNGATWEQPGNGVPADGVYVDERSNLKAGSRVEVTFRDGTTKIFAVVGNYTINYRSDNLTPPAGLLMTTEGFARVARPDSITCFVQVAPGQLNQAAEALAAALPQATVVNLAAYAGRYMESYRRLYILPMVMAGLAMLAGFLLVANSVTLAVLDRCYEIGILKTVGYSRRQILSIFGIEYGLVGLLATVAGVFCVEALLAVMAVANHQAAIILLLDPPSLALIAFCGVGLTLLTVIGVTWEPAGVPPSVVLNERN